MVNLRTFDYNLLKVFEAIVANGSVSRAADKLGMSQPAVSNALNRLREHLDDPLFVRTPDGMTPTPKAYELAEAVEEGLAVIRSGLSARTQFDPATSDRQFSLLMTDVGQIAFLPPLFEVLERSAPGVKINVLEAGVRTYADMLDTGMADLALGRITLPDVYERQLIHTSPFVVLISAGHPRIEGTDGVPARLTLDAYLSERHILVQPRGASEDPIRKALGGDAERRDICLTVPYATALPSIVEGTNLIATIPKVAADMLVSASRNTLVAFDVPFEITDNQVYLWWHRRTSADAGHIWLRNMLATVRQE